MQDLSFFRPIIVYEYDEVGKRQKVGGFVKPCYANLVSGMPLTSYDCPCGQVMSYDMLRIVMIGFAKF